MTNRKPIALNTLVVLIAVGSVFSAVFPEPTSGRATDAPTAGDRAPAAPVETASEKTDTPTDGSDRTASAAGEEKSPPPDLSRQKKNLGVALLLIAGIIVVGVVVLAAVSLYSLQMRQLARRSPSTKAPRDDFWYLRRSDPPSSGGGASASLHDAQPGSRDQTDRPSGGQPS